MSKSKIKRKDIISDDALNFGKEYAKNIDEAIQANERFAESLKNVKKWEKERFEEDFNTFKRDFNYELSRLVRDLHNQGKHIYNLWIAVLILSSGLILSFILLLWTR